MIVLASASPRRAELMKRLGTGFRVVVGGVDESDSDSVVELARRKFDAVAAGEAPDTVVIAADTLVFADGALGKPTDRNDAVEMVASLSGKRIEIRTGLCVGAAGATTMAEERVRSTTVELRHYSIDDVESYVATGEADDKAGGLALQGAAGDFVAGISGCWANVVGLPICDVAELLGESGWAVDAAFDQCAPSCLLREPQR